MSDSLHNSMQVVSEDIDDDSHMCLRCHAIIQGLEAYICHRKVQCRGLRPSQHEMTSFRQVLTSSQPPSPASTSAGTVPSTAVTCPSSAPPNHPHPSPGRSPRRDPLLAVIGTSDPHGDKGDKLLSDLVGPVMSADEFMSHLGLSIVTPSAWAAAAEMHPGAADDFFSSLELQSISKLRPTEAAATRSSPPPSSKKYPQHDHEWDQLSTPPKRLISASPVPDEIPPRARMEDVRGGQVEMSHLSAETHQFPYAYHKLFAGSNNSHVEGDELDSQRSNTSNSPLWPTIPVQSTPSIIPSRGKWMPDGTNKEDIRKNGSRVQYFCESCNRRLSSRLLYERHLQSDYHAKRLSSLTSTSPSSSHPAITAGPVAAIYGLRSQKRLGVDGSDDEVDSWDKEAARLSKSYAPARCEDFFYYPVSRKKITATSSPSIRGDQCVTCKAWIPRGLLGKHLISRFHVARSQSHARHQQLVLQHMPLIVREALYQCQLCRFYCHNRESFLQHWASDSHLRTDQVSPSGKAYFCGLCRRVSDSSALMGQHLQSAGHRQAEDIVSQSVPIIIQKITLLSCPVADCCRKFRLHFQVNRHLAQFHGHQVVQRLNTPEKLHCEHCDFGTTSRAVFTHHVHHQHPERQQEGRYRCLLCGLKFATKVQAVQHRSSQEHRDLARRNKWGEQRNRKCEHCYVEIPGMAALKQHMEQSHPTLLPRCPSCGVTFAIKQQLSAHRRARCQGASEASSSTSAGQGHSCPHCPFTTPVLADLLFHRGVEHSDLLKERINVPEGKVPCPECHRCYTQPALKKHVVVHTSERPYACRICGRRFSNPADLQKHRQHLHPQTLVTKPKN